MEAKMNHPLVDQLRFTRSEFRRGLEAVRDPEAQQRFGNMNCLSWIVGHLAWQEQRYWLTRAQGRVLVPELNKLLAYGKPASTPPVEEMWAAWRQVTEAADPWLEALTVETIQAPLAEGLSSTGTFMQRVLYHYWYHLGEGMAIRQMLGHTGLPDFVGNIDALAPYRPDTGHQLSEPRHKESLIQRVQEARARWDDLAGEVPESRWLEPGLSGSWSLKDVSAHLTWHEREMVELLKTRVLAGSELWLRPLDERNQAIYEENRALPLDEVRSQARQVYRELIEELEKLEEEDLHDPNRIAEMPSDWRLWDLLADNTYQHYLDHLPALQDWIAKGRGRLTQAGRLTGDLP
jgi:hypothetical protein